MEGAECGLRQEPKWKNEMTEDNNKKRMKQQWRTKQWIEDQWIYKNQKQFLKPKSLIEKESLNKEDIN